MVVKISEKDWDRIWHYQINGCAWKGYRDYLRETRKMLEDKKIQ